MKEKLQDLNFKEKVLKCLLIVAIFSNIEVGGMFLSNTPERDS